MSSSNGYEKESNVWRDILVGVIIAVIGGVIVAYLIRDARFQQPTQLTQEPPTISTQNPDELLAGTWSGIINNPDEGFSAELTLFFRSICNMNDVCGTYEVPQFQCYGNLVLVDIDGDVFTFLEQQTGNACGSGYQHIQKLTENSISYGYSETGNATDITTVGILTK